MMERNEIATSALLVMSGAAAAMGPVGVPAFLVVASLGAYLNLYGGKQDDEGPKIEDVIDQTVRNHFNLNNARTAWAKIKPAYAYYQSYVNRAEGGEDFSDRDLETLAMAINDAIGPNSELMQGLTLLYDARKPNELSQVEFNLPIYMLGASLLVQYRLLDIAQQKLNGEQIIAVQWHQVADLAKQFADSIDKIHRYVTTYTIQNILHRELNEGKFKLGSSELRERSDELQMHYVGEDFFKFHRYLQQTSDRLYQQR